AGHLPPLLRSRQGLVKSLGTEVSGLPLGIRPESEYSQVCIPIEPGSSVVMATDGITEAMNAAHEIFGTQRLMEFLKKAPPDAAPVGEAIVADVEAFCAGEPQRDDTCLICFHRLDT